MDTETNQYLLVILVIVIAAPWFYYLGRSDRDKSAIETVIGMAYKNHLDRYEANASVEMMVRCKLIKDGNGNISYEINFPSPHSAKWKVEEG